jgi:hypothetical protein
MSSAQIPQGAHCSTPITGDFTALTLEMNNFRRLSPATPGSLNNAMINTSDSVDNLSPTALQRYTIRVDIFNGEQDVTIKRVALWLCAQSDKSGNLLRSTFSDLGQLSYKRLKHCVHLAENNNIVYNVPPSDVVIQDNEDFMTAIQHLISRTTSTQDDLVLRLVESTGKCLGTLIPSDTSNSDPDKEAPHVPPANLNITSPLENQELMNAVILLARGLNNKKRKRGPETTDTENVHDGKRQTRLEDYMEIIEVNEDGKITKRRLREPVLGRFTSQHPPPLDDHAESEAVLEAPATQTGSDKVANITKEQVAGSAQSPGVSSDSENDQISAGNTIELDSETDGTMVTFVESSVDSLHPTVVPATDDQRVIDDVLGEIRADGDM